MLIILFSALVFNLLCFFYVYTLVPFNIFVPFGLLFLWSSSVVYKQIKKYRDQHKIVKPLIQDPKQYAPVTDQFQSVEAGSDIPAGSLVSYVGGKCYQVDDIKCNPVDSDKVIHLSNFRLKRVSPGRFEPHY